MSAQQERNNQVRSVIRGDNGIVLGEGSIVERLRRLCCSSILHPELANALVIYDEQASSIMRKIYKE